MRYRTGKTRSYTSKKKKRKKDTKLTTKNSANAFQTKPQPTQQNAAYKMTNIHVDEWHELLNIHYYEHLHKSHHISWSDFTVKSVSVL